jgi:hypothetical protein
MRKKGTEKRIQRSKIRTEEITTVFTHISCFILERGAQLHNTRNSEIKLECCKNVAVSLCPHEPTRKPLNEFSLSLIMGRYTNM